MNNPILAKATVLALLGWDPRQQVTITVTLLRLPYTEDHPLVAGNKQENDGRFEVVGSRVRVF